MANAKLIHFDSGGVKCAADLYLPDAGAYVYPRPGVVIGHGFSIIKSALVQQATYLVNAGYVVMAIDYRTFGESEGEPRAQIWPLDQVEDFRNAITWLEQRTELVIPERIGIWGVSFGGGVVLYPRALPRDTQRCRATILRLGSSRRLKRTCQAIARTLRSSPWRRLRSSFLTGSLTSSLRALCSS